MTDRSMTGREFVREAGDDLDKWTDAMAESASSHGYKVEWEWLRGWLADYAEAVRKAKPKPIPGSIPGTE
jgi:hypothetical protein